MRERHGLGFGHRFLHTVECAFLFSAYANLFSVRAAAYDAYTVWASAAASYTRFHVTFLYGLRQFLQLIGWD